MSDLAALAETAKSEPLSNTSGGNLAGDMNSAMAEARQMLAEADRRQDSWQTASNLVAKFNPVPGVLWPVVRGVFSGSQLGKGGQMAFWSMAPLLHAALPDKTLGKKAATTLTDSSKEPSLTQTIDLLGIEVAAALCFMHSVSRRASSSVPEKVSRPILDDALLRAQIGYLVGEHYSEFGAGRGMLAGFAGRCGLAIQIALGTPEQVRQTLEALAAGIEMNEVGLRVFGCDPLQVAAMALAAGGLSRDAAIGVAAFSLTDGESRASEESFLWLSAFSIIEEIRMGRSSEIKSRYWRALGIDASGQETIKREATTLLRRGHSWGWIVSSKLQDKDEEAEDAKAEATEP